LSTSLLERAGERVASAILIRRDEGLIIKLEASRT